jgi:hypothetical protein
MKSRLAMAVGITSVLLGLSVVVAPGWFLAPEFWASQRGLMTAAAIRVVVGVVLLLAARTSKYPRTFRVIGTIALVAGLSFPFIPLDFWGEFVGWWMLENRSLFRWLLAAGGTLLGAFIAYAALPSEPLRR